MKKTIPVLLICLLVLAGCAGTGKQPGFEEGTSPAQTESTEESMQAALSEPEQEKEQEEETEDPQRESEEEEPDLSAVPAVQVQTTDASARLDDPVETIASEDDLEVAQAIIDDLKERKGIEITESSNVHGVSEILFEAGYRDVDAQWLMETLFGQVAYSTRVVEPPAHTHRYVSTVDFDTNTVHMECECGQWYEFQTDDEDILNYHAGDKQYGRPQETTPAGYEYKRMSVEEYFRDTMVPMLYMDWGEAHYYWYCDEPSALVTVIVTVDGIEELLERVKKKDAEAKLEYEQLKERVKELSVYLNETMAQAGFRSTRVKVGIGDYDLAQSYIVEGDYVWHDSIEELEKTREELVKKNEKSEDGE